MPVRANQREPAYEQPASPARRGTLLIEPMVSLTVFTAAFAIGLNSRHRAEATTADLNDTTVDTTTIAPPRRRLVAFTLVRGGPAAHDYDMFVNSRHCLRSAVPSVISYDNVAFHEGVPIDRQLLLRQQVYAARPTLSRRAVRRSHLPPFAYLRSDLDFVDIRRHGGFPDAAKDLLPSPPQDAQLEYPIGYRHMVSLGNERRPAPYPSVPCVQSFPLRV